MHRMCISCGLAVLLTVVTVATVPGAALAATPATSAGSSGTASHKAPATVSGKGQATEQFVDGIAAVVNKKVITLSQLEDRVKRAVEQLERQKVPVPDMNTLRQQVLSRMIDTELENQAAAQKGIHVSDAQMKKAIESVAARNKMSVENLRREIEKSGIPWKGYQEQVRHEVLLDQLRRREVDGTIVITDADVDAWLKTHDGTPQTGPALSPQQSGSVPSARASGPVMLGLAQILVAVPEHASESTVQTLRKKAEVILSKLRAGASFSSIAAAASDGPKALSGGDIGVRPTNGWPNLFIDATAKLKTGQITDIIQSGNGFHILKVTSRTEPRGQSVERAQPAGPNPAQQAGQSNQAQLGQGPKMVTQTHARHILIKVTKVTSDEQAKERLLRLRTRIEHGEDFATLAKRYSQDASAPQGGDLGWLSPGETVPPFQHAMDALQQGQISQPVKSRFGWHLIQVLGRRTENMAEEYKRIQARQILFQERAGPAFEDWLNQLRGKAYIDNRLEPESGHTGN